MLQKQHKLLLLLVNCSTFIRLTTKPSHSFVVQESKKCELDSGIEQKMNSPDNTPETPTSGHSKYLLGCLQVN